MLLAPWLSQPDGPIEFFGISADYFALFPFVESCCHGGASLAQEMRFADKLSRNTMNKLVKPQLLHLFESDKQ